MALRKFTVEITVDELYEMTVRVPYKVDDWRDGTFTDYKTETKSFVDFNSACEWMNKNPNSEVLEFVMVTNKIEQLKNWTKQ